jgi:N-acetylneuraminic acid mutarotase
MREYLSPFAFLFGYLLACAGIPWSAGAQTTAANEWTWMGGSSTFTCISLDDCYSAAVYGMLGTPAAGNNPGGRSDASSWTDSSGHFWLFGGSGLDANGNLGTLNDLWEFNPSKNEWAWMGGCGLSCLEPGDWGQPGVYGTLGTPAAGNIPGGRVDASSWTDSSGHLWLFGGWGVDASGNGGNLNDLWEFNPSTDEWAWMGGSQSVDQFGVYGTLGTYATGNTAGGRSSASSWIDNSGNFWLFGGNGVDQSGNSGRLLNDLWEFNPSANEWRWMGGSSTVPSNASGLPGVYGILGTPAAGNIPGSRYSASSSSWTDSSGHLWLYGGYGVDANGNYGYLTDFWEFNPSTDEWAWMGGDSSAPTGWYCPPFISGNSCYCPPTAEYGTLGVPAPEDSPGGLSFASTWTDSNGKFWLFAGQPVCASITVALNDLWEFDPSMNEWAWMGGSRSIPQNGVYGALGTPVAGNVPGVRYSASSWTDASGNFWLFGGYGADSTGDFGLVPNVGYLNDMWEFQPVAPYTPAATPVFHVATGTSTTPPAVAISDATAGATIYYTTDGKTTPTTGSAEYTGAIIVSSTETIEAIALAPAYTPSPIVSLTYTLTPDFAVAASPASITVIPGQNGTALLTVTPQYGFSSAVSFSCSGLPAGASCSFSPATVTPSGAAASTTLTVSTAKTTGALYRPSNPLFPTAALAAALCFFGWRRRRDLQFMLWLAVAFAGLGLVSACGGGSGGGGGGSGGGGGGGGGSTPVTSTVTVTATSGSLQHTTTFSLTVD